MTTTWRLELLGGLRATRTDQDVGAPRVIDRFRSRQAGALLAFLAFHPRPHTREVLAELLWPDHDAQLSRNHLRVVLSSLRRDLEPEGVAPGSIIVADRGFVKLNPETTTTDVREFESELRNAVGASDPGVQIAHLSRAIELYGGALLPGFYENWIIGEAGRLEECFFSALHRLVILLERSGNLESALHFARRGAGLCATREDLTRDLMRLYDSSGQPALARRQFDELERALKGAWNTQPGPQTRELLRRIESESESEPSQERSQQSTAPLSSTELNPPSHEAPVGAEPKPGSTGEAAHLPPQWTRFFGRQSQIAQVRNFWQNGARLVTLTGVGGTGKTRLALEIARLEVDSQAGAPWFVALSDVADARLLAGEIADALRLPRAPGSPALFSVTQALRARSAPLLVLDNFEQLLPEGGAFVQELLAHVPQLRLLVTSRRELGIAGEAVLPVPALSFGADDASFEEILCVESVQLFLDRARLAKAGFRLSKHNASAVARLCARLEGSPLAIELCAARAGAFSPGQMLARLEKRLDFLTERAPGSTYRHPTLRAALDCSFALLWPELAAFWVRLCVFHGGFSIRGAASVADEPHAGHFLEQLRAASLVVREGERFRLLETIREFAGEKLDCEQNAQLQKRHARFFHELTSEEFPHILAAEAGRRVAGLTRLDPEHDNLRAALAWSLKHDPELAVELVHLLSPLWGSAAREAHLVAERALEQAPNAPPGLVSALLGVAATQAQWNGDHVRQRTLAGRRLALMRAQNNDLDAAWALFHLGCACESEGDFDAASDYFRQALGDFQKWQDQGPDFHQNVGWTLGRLGECALFAGKLDEAQGFFEGSSEAFRRGNDSDGLASTLSELGQVARARGDLVRARRLFDECDALQRELGDERAHPFRHFGRAHLLWDEGDLFGARESFARALRELGNTGHVEGTLRCLWALGCIAAQEGDAGKALLLLGCEMAQREERACLAPPLFRAAQERALQKARDALGAGFETPLAQGRTLLLEAGVALALRREK